MGQGLPKAVTPIVAKRNGGRLFRVGFAEMNGWRPAMEDDNVIYMTDTCGFFGVFDGHGGRQCSTFIADRLYKELKEQGPPADDAATKALMLRLDQEFLDTKQPSGSTGTFVLVKPPAEGSEDKKYSLRVGNIGDSRVLLSRADGTLVEGPGTDGGLTTDHKPDHPDERERIVRTGGTVEYVMSVPRVNGDLAVSRSFGDATHKETGGPAQEDHPISAEPEMMSITCDPTDFIVLVCDGISEGNFPNREVVQLAAEEMRACNGPVDPAAAAAAVCRRALDRGSTDNLSCMIVLLGGGEVPGPELAFIPGPFGSPNHSGFRKAYAAMAEHAGLKLEEAVELRYDAARAERTAALMRCPNGDQAPGAMEELRAELALFGEGPPESLAAGSPERTAWFREWLDKFADDDPPDLSNMTEDQIATVLERSPRMLTMARMQGVVADNFLREIQVKTLDTVRAEVERHPALKWDGRISELCNRSGRLMRTDSLDGTVQVKVGHATVWLPSTSITGLEERLVRCSTEDRLKLAVEEHPALKWQERLLDICGQTGRVIVDDKSDNTSQVRFDSPRRMVVWLPTDQLTDVDEPAQREVRVVPIERLRSLMEGRQDLPGGPLSAETMVSIAGRFGRALQDDETDRTSQVCFGPPIEKTIWLPTEALINLGGQAEPESEPDGEPDGEPAAKRQRSA
eukprot:TRINITY_DN30745_c0_g1_i1.p1 TRINITY_DN30745_c0_g1~~TRINITY_DN30745_c0_g1_i1.p1  ORF type:complete len:684 (-),score=132.28 TRINITY_DN30745_c0_g1_i1:145-2196(-)